MVSEDTSLVTTAVPMMIPLSPSQVKKSDADRVNHPLGKPSRREKFKILDMGILSISWICFTIAVIAITPRLHVAWSLRFKHQIQLIGLMLSVMNQCLRILGPKLWIMAEAWRSKPKLQNLDAILRNSFMISNAHVAWRALLLTLNILPIALSLAYKEFIGGISTHNVGNHTSWYGLTASPGLSNDGILKFGPSYMTNATLPFIMAASDPKTHPQFPQTYGFNNLVISNTSSAFLDVPLPGEVRPLQRSLQNDTTSSFTLTANVLATVTTYDLSIEKNRDNDAFWDFYLNQRGSNSTPDSFSSAIKTFDLCSGKHLGMFTGDEKTDASWTILSFLKSSDLAQSPDIYIPAFRANALLFNTRREICNATWEITYNAIHLVEGDCSVSSPVPKQDFLVTPSLVFDYTFNLSTYYRPSLVEYLAPLSPAIWDTTVQGVYHSENPWLMPTFTTTVAAMYWLRITVLFGPDSYSNQRYNTTPPAWNDEVNYTTPDTLLSNRRTMSPSWALYAVLIFQPILISLIFVTSFVLSQFSAVDGGSFGIIAILAGVRTETLKLLDGASFSGTLTKPVSVQIDEVTKNSEEQPQIEYSFYDDGNSPKPSFIATLRKRFANRNNIDYHQINM